MRQPCGAEPLSEQCGTLHPRRLSACTIEVHSIDLDEQKGEEHETRLCMGRSLRCWRSSRRFVRQSYACAGIAVRDRAGGKGQFE